MNNVVRKKISEITQKDLEFLKTCETKAYSSEFRSFGRLDTPEDIADWCDRDGIEILMWEDGYMIFCYDEIFDFARTDKPMDYRLMLHLCRKGIPRGVYRSNVRPHMLDFLRILDRRKLLKLTETDKYFIWPDTDEKMVLVHVNFF